MKKPKEEFERCMEALRTSGLGKCEIDEFPQDGGYFYGTCQRSFVDERVCLEHAALWVSLALKVGGYLTLNVYKDLPEVENECSMMIAIVGKLPVSEEVPANA